MKTKIFVLLGLALLVAASSAGAVRKIEEFELRAGDLVIKGYGGFRPETLPKNRNAPVEIFGGGKLSTVSGGFPPIIDELNLEFDRHGAIDTTGLGVCTQRDLIATDVPAARRACGDAIVGTGFGRGVIVFPEQPPIPAGSGLTLFNGPKKNGNYTVLVHFHVKVPAPVTFIIPVEIKRINKGVYGYRTEAKIPKIAGGNGIPLSGSLTVGKKWTYKGKKHSYISARCATGRLQGRGEFTFKDGTILIGTFIRPCKVRG
jgi:hypothetical protein